MLLPLFQQPPDYNYYIDYINQPAIRKIMKVGKMPYGAQSDAVEKAIVLDIMDTVRDWLAVLMENYKVIIHTKINTAWLVTLQTQLLINFNTVQ